MQQKEFPEDEITGIMESVARNADKKLSCYLLGGAVMVFNGIKLTTKDIDIAFESLEKMNVLIKAAEKAGFVKTVPRTAHPDFQGKAVLENLLKGWKLDLYAEKIAGKMELSDSMRKRAKLFRKIGNLEIYSLSFEDIFLLKSLTERERDLDDMRLIMGFGIDMKTVENEIVKQDKFAAMSVERILEFGERYNIDIKLSKKAKQLAGL